ncbi:MAG: hypothetical protein ACRC28_04065 [Clostridium sp.]|uniref:hypothetical protein n=1 Tax=Clostridium sp. TaxID=1506 RepID=UPI003F2BB965
MGLNKIIWDKRKQQWEKVIAIQEKQLIDKITNEFGKMRNDVQFPTVDNERIVIDLDTQLEKSLQEEATITDVPAKKKWDILNTFDSSLKERDYIVAAIAVVRSESTDEFYKAVEQMESLLREGGMLEADSDFSDHARARRIYNQVYQCIKNFLSTAGGEESNLTIEEIGKWSPTKLAEELDQSLKRWTDQFEKAGDKFKRFLSTVHDAHPSKIKLLSRSEEISSSENVSSAEGLYKAMVEYIESLPTEELIRLSKRVSKVTPSTDKGM